MGKFSGASSVQRAQGGQLAELDLPTGPQPTPQQAPAQQEAPVGGSLMDQLKSSPPPQQPTPEQEVQNQADVAAAVGAGIEPLAEEVERQAIPSMRDRAADTTSVNRWLRPVSSNRSGSSQSPDGNLRTRAKSMSDAVMSGTILPIISSRAVPAAAELEQQGYSGQQIADTYAAEKEGSLVAAVHRANAVIKDANGKNVPAPEYVQVASAVTENMIADLAYGAETEADPIALAVEGEQQSLTPDDGPPQAVTHAAGNGRLGQQIHQEFQRMQGVKVPEKLPHKEAETVGAVFKDMWAANNPDLVTKMVDPSTNQYVYQLTDKGNAAMRAGETDRKRLFPKQKVRPAKIPLTSGQLPGDIGENVVRKAQGAVGKPEFGKVINAAMRNLSQVPNVVNKQRAKLLYSTILPVLKSGDHTSWQAEINNFGNSKIQKFAAAAAQQQKRMEEAQAEGRTLDEDIYDPQANMESLTDKIAQEVRAIAQERNGANYLTYSVQGFQGRISPQQSFFDPTTSKAVRFVTTNAVPAVAKPGSRIEKNLRQMYAMMLVKGADADLPDIRDIKLTGAAPKLEQWGNRLKEASPMTDEQYEAISLAIEQGMALTDENFPPVPELQLDPEGDAELIAFIESKGEDGPHTMDGLIDFANYAAAKRDGRPHASFFNAYMDGKTNGLASNGVQMGHIGTAERTGVTRSNRKQLLDDGDIRDELKKIAIDSIKDGWDGNTDGYDSELNDVAEQVFGNRDLNKKTTMTFGYGKEIDSFTKDIEETIALLSEMKAPASQNSLGADPNSWDKKQKTDYMQWQRARLKEESSYGSFQADVLFHSSNSINLDADTFAYRPVNVSNKGASGKGPGIFTHGADTEAGKYGSNVYAIIHDKNKPSYAGKEDTSATALDEIFLPQNSVEEITRIWPPGPDVVSQFAEETGANRPSTGDSYNNSLAVVDENMSRSELAQTLMNKYESSLREVISDDALEARELMRGAAALHSATNQLMSIKSPVGMDLNLGREVSTGYDAADKTQYRLYGEGVTGPDKRTVAHYDTEATSAAVRQMDSGPVPGEYAYGGSVVAPVQAIDASTVALTAAGKSWDRLKASSGNNPYMHTIYDAFKVDAMGYDVVLEEVNKNWLNASMNWSYLQATHDATKNALQEFNKQMTNRNPNEPLSPNERVYMDWFLKPEESKSGKLIMKNFLKKMSKFKTYPPDKIWDAHKKFVTEMKKEGYDVYKPPEQPTVRQLHKFVRLLSSELDLGNRLRGMVEKTDNNKKRLKQEILKKGYKTPSGERIALQYYAH